MDGGAGDDTLNGLAGNDTLTGGYGNDILSGGDGNDTLAGGLGADTLTGGAGDDTFKFNSVAELLGTSNTSPYNDAITDLQIGDKIDLSAIPGLHYVGVGNDFTGAGNEISFDSSSHSLGIDINGDQYGEYRISLPSDVAVLEETTPGSRVFQAPASLTLNGTAGNDTLTGGNGNDTLYGLAGNDTLNGGYGNDILSGGDGNDILVGGLGVDSMLGGAGNDRFKFNSLAELGTSNTSPYNDNIADLQIGDKIDLSAIPGLHFVGVGNNFTGADNEIQFQGKTLTIHTNGYSNYYLSTNASVLEETSPGSQVFQIPANLTLNGTAGNDTLNGGNGNDTLNGLAGNDTLNGGYGTDTLNGGDGNDILNGGLGEDTLTGGAGSDTFAFSSSLEADYDYITDFAAGDKIDLSGIDANPVLPGDQAFSFIGASAFTGTPGELNYQYGHLYGDLNGDKNWDFTIYLGNSPTLTSGDFIL